MSAIQLPGFEGRVVEVRPKSALGGFIVMLDGQPAPASDKKNHFLLKRKDGKQVEVGVRGGYPDPAPVVTLDGQKFRTARALSPLEWAWAGFPILLIFVGGLLGGMLGAVAMITNINLLRSPQSAPVRFGVSALISASAILLWFVLVTLLQARVKG